MKKYLMILFAITFLFTGCSTDDNPNPDPDPGEQPGPGIDPNPDPEPKESPYKTGIDMSTSFYLDWDNSDPGEYSYLGYGYDVTDRFAHPASVRKKIFDLDIFLEDYRQDILIMPYPSGGAEYYFWGTEEQCRQDLATHADFKDEDIRKYKNLFKGEMLQTFENDNVFPDIKYTYFGYSGVITTYSIRFSLFEWMRPEKYVTEEFKSDLEILTAEEILEMYGTHMIVGFHTGTKMNYIYRTTDSDIYEINRWVNYYSNYLLDLGSPPSKPGDIDPPLKDNMYIEFVNGYKPNPNAYMIDILNYKGDRIHFEGIDDKKEENSTLVGFTRPLCPIYSLVPEGDKRDELQKAFEVYMGAANY